MISTPGYVFINHMDKPSTRPPTACLPFGPGVGERAFGQEVGLAIWESRKDLCPKNTPRWVVLNIGNPLKMVGLLLGQLIYAYPHFKKPPDRDGLAIMDTDVLKLLWDRTCMDLLLMCDENGLPIKDVIAWNFTFTERKLLTTIRLCQEHMRVDTSHDWGNLWLCFYPTKFFLLA